MTDLKLSKMNDLIDSHASRDTKTKLSCLAFALMLLGGLGYGIFMLAEASEDPHSEEVYELNQAIDYWNYVYPSFENLTVSISPVGSSYSLSLPANTSAVWMLRTNDTVEYRHLKYYSKGVLVTEGYPLSKVFSGTNEYFLAADFDLTVTSSSTSVTNRVSGIKIMQKKHYPLNMKMCRNHRTGYWDNQTQRCYYYYKLTKLCIPLNEQTYQLPEWSLKGCSSDGREHLENFRWTESQLPQYQEYSLEVEVRSQHDPYVYAMHHGLQETQPTAGEFALVGLVLTGLSALMLTIPISYFCTRKRSVYRFSEYVIE